MTNIIRCYTLFNITKTGIRQRGKIPDDVQVDKFIKQRNSQNNFDTLLQVISLRSQPEVFKDPIFRNIDLKELNFGFIYESTKEMCDVWYFDFEVHHPSVFNDGINQFGNLYKDCNNIPMMKVEKEHTMLSNFLDISPELQNIYFEFV